MNNAIHLPATRGHNGHAASPCGGAAAGARTADRRGLSGIAADDPESQARIAAFVEALQRLGWTDGGNVQIDLRWGGGDPNNIRKQAAELAALAPEVILATGGSATEQLLRATR